MATSIESHHIHLLNTYNETIADGAGIRYSIYLAGCSHACKGCHNRASWHPKAGVPLTDTILHNIITTINANPLLDGITISGGDPFFNPHALLPILQILKQETNQNIWCYTGYTYEQLLTDETKKACLTYIDTLVDGRFEIDKLDLSLSFRGSSNQRILHLDPNTYTIKKSL